MAQLNDKELQTELQTRFKSLPKVVQNSITSADIEKRLRELANTNNLHLDQWQLLENNVMMTLLGLQDPADLAHHFKKDLDISDELAVSLATETSHIVFEPIRQELERSLEHPEAKEEVFSDEEKARREILSKNAAAAQPATAPASPVGPATPPAPVPTEKAVRLMPTSGAYKPGEASAARKDVHDDPYRETPA